MKNRNYVMPNGTSTSDANTYANAWCSLGDKVAEALGYGWKMVACNPGIVVACYRTTDRGKTVEDDRLTLSLRTAKRIIELYEADSSVR